jgi:uncharacterized protein (DUF952 family)
MRALPAGYVYKICPRAEWEVAVLRGVYRGSEVDLRDGFIHLSTATQVDETLRRHFAGQTELLLISVDPAALGPALLFEVSRGGELFPHLYGELSVSHVREVRALAPVMG